MEPLDKSFDAELRAVPVPDGLVERLRDAALADDEGLDAALLAVAVPADLTPRLLEAMLADDEVLDSALRDVPFADELVWQWQSSLLEDDDTLDAVLRDVPVPLRRPRSTRRSTLVRLGALAVAASLLAVVALGGLGDFSWIFRQGRPSPKVVGPSAVSPRNVSPKDLADSVRPGAETIVGANRDTETDELPWRSLVDMVPAQEASNGGRAPAPLPDTIALFEAFREGTGIDPLSEAAPLTSVGPTVPYEGTAYGRSEIDRLPDLRKIPGPSPRGIQPPLVRGFDLNFLIQTGMHPFVSPAAHPRLQTSVVPLGVDTSSYDLTRRCLDDGELPPPNKVRTEEFLAAMDYQFPSPTEKAMDMSAYAGPSPFGAPGTSLLQLGVQARRFQGEQHPPVHLVLAVDISGSMQWGGRVDMVRRALCKVAERLGPDDRLSLVVFNDRANVLIENAGRAEADQISAAANLLSAQGATDLAGGLHKAYTIAREMSATGAISTRVVLLSDGTAEVEHHAAEMLERRLAEAAARQIRLEIVDLGQQPPLDPQSVAFARAGGGRVHRVASSDQILWDLSELITGKSQLLASDARLKITFDSKIVREYRLLGHEAAGIASLMPDHPEADFHAGQSATGLYELLLRPGSDYDAVASAELTWLPRGGHQREQIVRTITRKDLAPTFAQSSASLQAAALAAQVAEALRNPRVPRGVRPLAGIRELAAQVEPQLRQRPSFVDLMALVAEAEKAKPYRGGRP